MTIEWKMSNSSTSVENIGCLLWNICAAQGTTVLYNIIHCIINEINHFRCAEHAVSPQDDSQASPSQGFMMRKVLLG